MFRLAHRLNNVIKYDNPHFGLKNSNLFYKSYSSVKMVEPLSSHNPNYQANLVKINLLPFEEKLFDRILSILK